MTEAKYEPPAWIQVEITFAKRKPMTLTIANGTAEAVVERLAGVLGRVVPDSDICLDLYPRSFQLAGTGYIIELADRRRIANIRIRRAVGKIPVAS